MASPPDLQQLKTLLEKKATFEQGVQQLTHVVSTEDNPAALPEAFSLIQRSYVLLKARYSNTQFWKAGCKLFVAASGVPGWKTDQQTKLQQYLKDAQDFLKSEEEESSPEAQQPIDLPSLLMAGVMQPSQAPTSHFDDAGLIIDDPERLQRAQTSGSAATSAEEATGEQQEQQPRRWTHADLQQSILEGILAVNQGMEAVARSTEAIEQELENVLDILHQRAQQQQRPSRPPASKKLVASLPKVTITEENITEIGKDSVCAVCTETLRLGDTIQILPCKHKYHPDCVAPWLSKHNSCPTCRHELPTDDPNYEAKKEKEAEEAEERRGAANALSHNEFQYI